MNKVILIGRLTKDPEIKVTSSDLTVAHYTLAVDRKFKKDGEPDADFLPCVAFGKPAEFAEKYLAKGAKIAICGRLQTRSYDDKYGQKKYITEIVVDEQYFAESKRNSNNFQEQIQEMNEEPKNISENNSQQQIKEIAESLDDEDLPLF